MKLTSHLVQLVRDDIDTDQIIPARFLKVTDKKGLGEKLFADWRYQEDGTPIADFPLNQASADGARVLLAGDNFGCGSSREHAPWALVDFGFQAVIARSFADIFAGNALKNGLLPVAVSEKAHKTLLGGGEVSIDLATQTLTLPGGEAVTFEVDPFAKHCLLEGVDELGYLLSLEGTIASFEASRVG
ncbi:MAG: 3-isopropylmalate dehydratase small subunit [Myxococcota bacterium]